MITIENLAYRYRGSSRQVFSSFGLEIGQNRICGLLGKNGTGKSTLLYLISGLLRPVAGSVRVDGQEARLRRPEMLGEMFLVPEEYALPNIKLRDYLAVNAPFYPRFSHEVFSDCLNEFEMPSDINLKNLSMGQKKKVIISFALAAQTRYLLMDEPTNGLDIPSKSQFRKVVSQSMSPDRTMIISTHQVHDVESLIDQVVMLTENGLAMNATVEEICQKYSFEYREVGSDMTDVVYSEPTASGYKVMAQRHDGGDTQVDLELLFSAISRKGNKNLEF